MTEAPALVSVRFKTARSGLCGCHLAGIDYPVSPEFAKQVVEIEGVADYVAGESASIEADSSRPARRKR